MKLKQIVIVAVAFLVTATVRAQTAHWITADDSLRNEPNTWMEFRKEFTLKKKPKKAEARIAADSKYWLWVNGQLAVFEGSLKRGPNPTDSYYDVVDLAPHLQKGRHQGHGLLQSPARCQHHQCRLLSRLAGRKRYAEDCQGGTGKEGRLWHGHQHCRYHAEGK